MEKLSRFGLARAGFGLIVVLPANSGGNDISIDSVRPPRLQTEVRAAIIDEIELDVAAAANQLKLAFAVRSKVSFLRRSAIGR